MRTTVSCLLFFMLLCLIIALEGCGARCPKVNSALVHYETVENYTIKQSETILVCPFVDNRKDYQKPYIGEYPEPLFAMFFIHLKSGCYIAEQNDVKIPEVLRNCFSDALKVSGYKVFYSNADSSNHFEHTSNKAKVLLKGEIYEFWLTPAWTTKHRIHVKLKLFDIKERHLLWEEEIKVDHSEFEGYPNSGAYSKIISNTLSKARDEAVIKFDTNEFYQKVIKR